MGTSGLASAEPSIRAGAPLPTVVGVGSATEFAVELELEGLASATSISIALPHQRLNVERQSVERQPHGVYWVGASGDAWVYLTTHENGASGLVTVHGQNYELFAGPDGAFRLAELDGALFPPCATDEADGPFVPRALPPVSSAVSPGPTVMDALVVYTPQARDGAGGESQIETVIQNAINITNTAYENSQVDARLHLIHTQQINIDDSGSSSVDLRAIRNSTTAAALRDRYGADLVAMIVQRNGACGRGYVQRNPGPGFASNAYQVTTRSCAVGNLSFAHEFGHNQGCEHDPANGTSPANAAFPFAFGHFHSGAYRTVMSYSNQCSGGCGRAPFFSNSNVSNDGLVTGILDQRENYRTINNTAPIVAAFRASAVTLDLDQTNVRAVENLGAVRLNVNRTGLADVPVTVFVSTDEDEALAGRDFTATTATLTWPAFDTTSRTVTVPIIDDRERESPEGFDVVLHDARGAGLGATTRTRVTIDDYEEGRISFGDVAFEVRENAGSLAVRVERQDGGNGAVGVDWAVVPGTATEGTDLSSSSGRLSWSDGDARAQSFTIDILDDEEVEGDETFRLVLSAPTGGANLGIAEATVTLRDWEEGAVRMGSTSAQIVENAGNLVLPLTRTQGTDGPLVVEVSFGPPPGPGTAEPRVDFSFLAPQVEFADGASTATLTLAVIDDALEEGDERFTVTLTGTRDVGRIEAPLTTEVRVTDWEEGALAFTSTTQTVDEDAQTMTVQVVRSGGTDGPGTVRYATRPGSADEGLDFAPTTGELSWATGEDGAKTFSIPVLDDDLVEGPETFSIRLSNEVGLRLEPREAELLVEINDREPGTLRVGVAEVSLEETAEASAQSLRVVRTNGTLGTVGVSWRLRGLEAEAGTDFVAAEGTLSFADREAEKTVSFELIDDLAEESDERFVFELASPTGGASLGEDVTTVTIADAGGGEIVGRYSANRAPEKEGEVVLTLERRGEAYGALELQIGVDGSSSASPDDVSWSPNTVQWADGETGLRSVTVAMVDDELDEGDEFLALSMTSMRRDVAIQAIPSLLIEDDDGGCSCATAARTGDTPPRAWALGLLGLLFVRRRRR